MQTIEYTTMDKTKWPRGQWDNEPDKKQWQDKETGLACLIVRNSMGALCGYVGVPEGHKFFGKGYDDANDLIDVHGGLTFADHCMPSEDESQGICHKPDPTESDKVWWLGFDCGHWQDLIPELVAHRLEMRDGVRIPEEMDRYEKQDIYRNFQYVTDEVTNLAAQLKRYAEA